LLSEGLFLETSPKGHLVDLQGGPRAEGLGGRLGRERVITLLGSPFGVQLAFVFEVVKVMEIDPERNENQRHGDEKADNEKQKPQAQVNIFSDIEVRDDLNQYYKGEQGYSQIVEDRKQEGPSYCQEQGKDGKEEDKEDEGGQGECLNSQSKS